MRVDQIGDLALTRVYLYAGPNNGQWTFIFNISHFMELVNHEIDVVRI